MAHEFSLRDTAVAFSSLSDAELKRSVNLFRLMNNPTLVKVGSTLTRQALKLGLPIKGVVKSTIFKQFCGGETIAESQTVLKKLSEHRVFTIMDYGKEAAETEEELEKTVHFLVKTLELAKADPHINIISSKISGLIRFSILEKVSANEKLSEQEAAEYKRGIHRVKFLSKAAYDSDVQVYFDAEESWIQPAIDDIVTLMMKYYNQENAIIFNTMQMYRHDRLEYLKNCFKSAQEENYTLAVKIVRGAYMEKERNRAELLEYDSPIQVDKASTDKDFNAAIDFCLENYDEITFCCATHNEESTLHLATSMINNGIERDTESIWFSQLYGMSDHLTFNLANAGFNAAKYLVYGPVSDVIPYLIRRAQENMSVSGDMSRELSFLSSEVKRRKEDKSS